jgi:glycine cleavage system H protein
MNTPTELKYAPSDEWIKIDGNIATVGISEYAQDQLSDVVFVEIVANVGETITKNAVIATVESVKAAADVISPLSGKIIQVNDQLSKNPEQINSDPYGKAWMVKIEFSNSADLNSLMDSSAYEASCQGRSH